MYNFTEISKMQLQHFSCELFYLCYPAHVRGSSPDTRNREVTKLFGAVRRPFGNQASGPNINSTPRAAFRVGKPGATQGGKRVRSLANLAREECFPLNPWECLPELQPKPRPIEIPPKISKGRRFAIFTRDEFCCLYCGRSAAHDRVKLHVDHIIPRSKGGSDADDNLVTACKDCNLGKHNKHSGDPRRKRETRLPDGRWWVLRRLAEFQIKSLRRIDRADSLGANYCAQGEAMDELYDIAMAEAASGNH